MAQEKWFVDGPRTIDIERITRLKVSLTGGDVSIVGSDDPGVRIEVHSIAGKPLLVELDGDELSIDHPQIGWDRVLEAVGLFRERERADITVTVPRAVPVKLGVVRAPVLVTGLAETVTLNSAASDIVLDAHHGEANLNTVGGEIAVRDHRGSVVARTVSGEVTASGAIDAFTCDSVSGSVFLDVTGVPGTVRVNTVSGGVTARLEPDVPVRYRINTATGRLRLDDEEVSGIYGSYTSSPHRHAGPEVDFRVNTVAGNVSVLRGVVA